MFRPPLWLGNMPLTNMNNPLGTDNFNLRRYQNFEMFPGVDTPMTPVINKHQKTLVIKNLPPRVTKEMISDFLNNSWPMPIGVNNIDLHEVVDEKRSCKIEFSKDDAHLFNFFHKWYMRINNLKDASHESQILIEYPDNTTETAKVYPPVSEATLQKIDEDLGNDSTFKEALSTVEFWLREGEVNRRNADAFINLLQQVYNKVNLLINEKLKCDNDIRRAKSELREKVEGLSSSLRDMKNVLQSAFLKKVWDHFSKPQRKNLENWKLEVEELEQQYSMELINDREEDEMEISDTEDESPGIPSENQISSLKDQLDTLVNQKATLELELNEIEIEKDDSITQSKSTFHDKLKEVVEIEQKLSSIRKELEQSRVNQNEVPDSTPTTIVSASSSNVALTDPPRGLSEKQVYRIGLLTSFLNLHVNGATIEYLTSYLEDSGDGVSSEEVEDLMRRFPNMFTEESIGIGATLRKVWKYMWFDPPTNITSTISI